MRNQINYQHEFDVWYPYGAPAKAVAAAAKKITATIPIRLDYDANRQPIEAFSSCCSLVSAINMDISHTLRRRAGAQRFAQLWDRLITEAAN
jgi:hypothetical protein